MRRRQRSGSRRKSQLPTPGGCRHNQADELRFVFLSRKPPPHKKGGGKHSHWEKELWGCKDSFNFSWGINWAFRWAERPWIWKDEKRKKKNQRVERICFYMAGCGEVQGRRRMISVPFLMFFIGIYFSTSPSQLQFKEAAGAFLKWWCNRLLIYANIIMTTIYL